MNDVASDFIIEEYQSVMEELTQLIQTEPEALQQLLGFIEEKIDQAKNNSDALEFLKGEHAYYSGQYERSLQHYLLAKAIPRFEFYCFRSSAFAAKEIGNAEKAAVYLEKAKRIYDYDPSLLELETQLNAPEEEPLQSTNNPGSGFFASQKTVEPASTEELTKRLYTMTTQEKTEIKETLPIPETQDNLEERILAHQAAHENAVLEYIELAKKRNPVQDHTLFMISGWKTSYSAPLKSEDAEAHLVRRILQSNVRGAAAYGFYIRWKNKGYVVNPGVGFLETFHKQGFHINDIDYVIVTRNEPETYTDARQIYNLNYQVNKVSSELHVIHYYLNQTCYQELSRILKPNFKQERNAIHCLEIFIDSPEVEKTQITQDAALHYFPIYQRGGSRKHVGRTPLSSLPSGTPSLGIRLDFTSDETPLVEGSGHTVKLGYLSGASWSPRLADHLGECDVLVSGFGHTSTQDYCKADYNDDSLGYYGTFSLLENLRPRVLFCTEFDGFEGDIRLDVIKKMRQESAALSPATEHPSVLLPSDTGLSLSLQSLRIKCSITQEWLDPTLVQVVKTVDSFGPLKYLSPDSCL